MKSRTTRLLLFFLLALILVPSNPARSQSKINRDTMLHAARELMDASHYCALVTLDSSGSPHVRTMNPYPANDQLITWFATSRTSRKVHEIRNNPHVCVYYANHEEARGYVSITGLATVIDDKDLLLKMKRDYWNGIPGWQEKFVLIKVVPVSLEVINYKHGLNNDPNTFKAPTLVF